MSFNYPQTERIINHIVSEYGVEPEFLWPGVSPRTCIFRNPNNRKWFAAIMPVLSEKLGLNPGQELEIIDLKFDKNQALDFARETEGIFPGYHMNKNNWITIILNDSLPDETIFNFISHSAKLTDGK